VAPKRNIFLGKHFADPTIKKSKIFLAILYVVFIETRFLSNRGGGEIYFIW
jgi:hypothetical protein